MQIQKISNYSVNSYSPKFSGVYRDVYAGKTVQHRNTSWMFRPSVFLCKKFYEYISAACENLKKVNVYNYASSLGYEAYSFIIGMYTSMEKNPEKFFPIIAKDYDEIIIQGAKKNIIPLECPEVKQIEQMFNNDKARVAEFITFADRLKLLSKLKYSQSLYDSLAAQGDTLGTLLPKLTDNVQFSVADIRTDYPTIEPENSIVLATNFWLYMSDEDRFTLAKNLYNQLGENCYIKIDQFDNGSYPSDPRITTANILLQNGFKPTPIFNLFKK